MIRRCTEIDSGGRMIAAILTHSEEPMVSGLAFDHFDAIQGTPCSAIGGWILGLLGLHALVEDLIGTLPRALQYYQQGIQEAWRSSSENRSCSGPAEWNHGSLSQASFLLANGHVQMVIALLSALMLWISRGRGERANALQSINQSARLGPGFAKWIEANEEKLHTLLASRSRQGGGGAGRVAESAAKKAATGGKGSKVSKDGGDGGKIAKPPKRKPKRRCELVPYEELECGPGQDAHHVVPDWMLRVGKRKGPERIPGLPSLDRGPAICLEGGSGKEHNVAHKHTDRPAERVARSGRSTGTAGTLKLGQGKRISARAIEKATGGKKGGGCDRKDIQKQLDEMIRAHDDTLLRGVKDARKVTGGIRDVLVGNKDIGK